MERYQSRFRFLAALTLSTGVVLANAPIPDSDANVQYVYGSWVNVRSLPATDASVIDHIIVNTPVRVANDATTNGFCEITYEERKQGYVACRLLGDKPLSLEDIDKPYDASGRNPLYSPTRAFWIQPTVERLFAAGQYFEATKLKPGELDAERKSAKEAGKLTMLQRFPIPEYEAMKKRMQQGTMGVLGDDHWPPPEKWQVLKKKAADNLVEGRFTVFFGLERQDYIELIRALELPPTKQSYFRNANQPIPLDVTTETASALFGIPYRAEVKSGPRWIPPGHYDDDDAYFLLGAWDIGEIESHLVSPALKHTLLRNSKMRTETTDVRRSRFPQSNADSDDCHEGFSSGDAGAALSAMSDMKPGQRLYYFFTKAPLPYDKANVIRSKNKFSAARFTEAETFRFDIDHDGIDDIFVWEGTGISRSQLFTPISAPYFRMFFFNIDGEWFLFGIDEFIYACGC